MAFLGTDKWINPVNGIITSSYGSRTNPVLDKEEFHDGIDIAVPEGTDVIAIKDGEVIETGNSKTYGIYIKYKTNDNYIIKYAHLSKIYSKKGDKIKSGQTIALSGNTGLTTGPHLHYSLWKDDEITDPINYVNLKYTADVKNEYRQRGVVLN